MNKKSTRQKFTKEFKGDAILPSFPAGSVNTGKTKRRPQKKEFSAVSWKRKLGDYARKTKIGDGW